MNISAVERVIEHILKWEGGFTDNPIDAGGPTNMGVTMLTLSKWLGREASSQEIMDLDRPTAIAIYDQFYIEDMPYRGVADEWSFMYLVDMGVLHSPQSLAKIVQKACDGCVKVDGIFGPATLAAVDTLSRQPPHSVGERTWRDSLRRERCLHYARRVCQEPSQATFLEGWVRRAFDL